MRLEASIKKKADWNTTKAGALAMLIHRTDSQKSLLFYFNARSEAVKFYFPEEPVCNWQLPIDTQNPGTAGHQTMVGANVTLINHSMQIWEEV